MINQKKTVHIKTYKVEQAIRFIVLRTVSIFKNEVLKNDRKGMTKLSFSGK